MTIFARSIFVDNDVAYQVLSIERGEGWKTPSDPYTDVVPYTNRVVASTSPVKKQTVRAGMPKCMRSFLQLMLVYLHVRACPVFSAKSSMHRASFVPAAHMPHALQHCTPFKKNSGSSTAHLS